MKKALTIILCLTISLLAAVPALGAENKDESIYASLGYDGSVRTLHAVSRFTDIPAEEPLIDYGRFGDVKNLTTQDQPVIEDDRVIWDLGEQPPKEFYSQASVDKALPYTVELRYMLDGEYVNGDTLGGATGHITIEMDIRPNPDCDEDLKKNMMVQASVSLDSETCRNIQADGATLVVMGGAINLSYTVLPGEDAAYTLSMDAEDFTMAGITFNLVSYENMLGDFQDDLDGLTDGFDEMADAMDEMADGTRELKDGLSDMVDGLHDMDTGLRDLQDGAAEFATGMGDFDGGLGALHRGLNELSSGSGQIHSGLSDIDSNGAPLLQGYQGVYQGLDTLKQEHDTHLGAANSLLSNSDPDLVKLGRFYIGESTALGDTMTGLSDLNTGLNNCMNGISTLAGQYGSFHSGIAGLPRQVQKMLDGYDELQGGFGDIQSGIGDLADGMHTMYTETAGLPADIQELIDGQIEFRDGISEAKEEAQDSIDSFFPEETTAPVSFVDRRNTVRSVQYMLKTPDIEKPEAPSPDLEGNGERQGFFQRLIALFK